MRANYARHGLTLIASENWIACSHFIPVENLIAECMADTDCLMLAGVWDDPRNISDILRLWYLRRHPEETYIDSDCLLVFPVRASRHVQVPSCYETVLAIAKVHGGEVDTRTLKNSAGHFVDVYLIAGNGDASFFDRWIKVWAGKYRTRGGIAEALCYEPFDLSIIPSSRFEHLSNRPQKYSNAL